MTDKQKTAVIVAMVLGVLAFAVGGTALGVALQQRNAGENLVNAPPANDAISDWERAYYGDKNLSYANLSNIDLSTSTTATKVVTELAIGSLIASDNIVTISPGKTYLVGDGKKITLKP